MYKCSVIGLGYIGLPTAAIIANAGHEVIGYDINKNIIHSLNNFEFQTNEKGLNKLIRSKAFKKNFSAKDELDESDIFIIAVPTPFKKIDKKTLPLPNLDLIFDAIKKIEKVIKPGNLIIIESTSPVGTTERISEHIKNSKKCEDNKYLFAYCPERVLPGNLVFELINNDRVIGGLTEKATELASNFYSTFCKGFLNKTNSRTAELVKLSENAYRDLNIAFANELSIICDHYDINTYDLIEITNKHPRVNILRPGIGVGGHCIAVDPWFIASDVPELSKMIQASRHVNKLKTNWVINKIKDKIDTLKKNLKRDPKIACFGVTYKEDVDDIRESPASDIVKYLLNQENEVIVCDPNIKEHKNFKIKSIENCLNNTDLVVFLVAHKEFFKIDKVNTEYLDFTGKFIF